MDVGSKRTGVAISDELGVTAQALETVDSKKTDRLFQLIGEYKPEEIVVGLPLNMNGSEGPGAKEVISFVEVLKKDLSIPIKMWDERLTTMQVEKTLIGAGVSRRKRRKAVDKLAAQLILQSYLDSKNA